MPSILHPGAMKNGERPAGRSPFEQLPYPPGRLHVAAGALQRIKLLLQLIHLGRFFL